MRTGRPTGGKKAAFALLLAGAAAALLGGCAGMEGVTSSLLSPSGGLSRADAEAITATARTVAKSLEQISPEQEYYVGRAVGAVVLGRYPVYSDERATAYVNLLGQTLAAASDRPETFRGYHFLILDSDEINAFAAPGGLIFVTRGILRCARSEDGVAAILAHEIAHVQEKHGLQAIKKSRLTTAVTSVALTAAQTLGPDALAELTTLFDDSIRDITSTLTNSGYSRSFEREADRGAVMILQRVGYDPRALVDVLEVMGEKLEPKGLDFAKTHPDPAQRIKVVEKAVGEAPSPPPAPAARRERCEAALGGI